MSKSCLAFERLLQHVDDMYDQNTNLELSDDFVHMIIYYLRCHGNSQIQRLALNLICKITINFPHLLNQDNHSRIPMRGFSSRIPTSPSTTTTTMSSSSSPSITHLHSQFKLVNDSSCNRSSKSNKLKLTRPNDIGGPLSNFVRPTVVTQKISQITRSSLTNLTSRIITRQFSANSGEQQRKDASSQNKVEMQEFHRSQQHEDNVDDDQMLIDETIDLVGSDDNVNRYASKESIQNQQQQQQSYQISNATFDLCRRDGTFIKSPTRGLKQPAIGSVNSLPDAKEATSNVQRVVSKSRDSLNSIQNSNQSRVTRLRKSGNDLLGSSLSLTKSPEWGSEDMLNVSPIDNENCVMMMNSRLADLAQCKQFFNLPLDSDMNATKLLCLTPSSNENVNILSQEMDVDECDTAAASNINSVVMRIHDNSNRNDPQKRFSFGLDITECTLDCSIELCDTSMSSTMQKASPIDKQGSFDVDESLGILTPDQMKEFLDSTNTNHTNNNLDLPLIPGHKLNHQCRIDQTPSPEELPLDPVGIKMEDISQQHQQSVPQVSSSINQEVSQAESDPKTDMTKSVTSKVSSSIITSITSITSLDTGYIGDGEMSRPASRGADQQSPSKVLQNQQPAQNWQLQQPPAIHRQRQDPMTDSDFFTESDADDIFHQRENQRQRRAQVIDGQLYGANGNGLQGVIFEQQPQHLESDSCMESSGVFTDVENRGDDYLLNRLAENHENIQHHANDMSPDLSSDTITSSGTACSQKKLHTITPTQQQQQQIHHYTHHCIDRPREFINETSSSICSVMDECIVVETNASDTINLINDESFGSTKSSLGVENENVETNESNVANASVVDSVSVKKVTTSSSGGKKLCGTNRKTHKNEANFGLKKHEMSSRGIVKTNEKISSSKKSLNGKWEPVMNKIAENKNIKKKFDNVKSKVTCGAVKRASTMSSIKTPPSDDHSIVSTESTGAIAKRNVNNVKDSPSGGNNKRGRAFSKDSQQSSQSDLSLNGAASPKIIIKSSGTRSAKKRDVRTISSSPSDLGPPSKTNSTIQRSNARNITILQKRSPPQQQDQIIPTSAGNHQIDQLKASPPTKKIVPKRLINATPLQEKLPLKVSAQQQQQQQSPPINVSPRSSIRSSKTATPPPSNRNGIIIDSLNVSPKVKVKELENNNSSKIINKNNANVNKMQHEQQLLQQIIDQQKIENQKQLMEILHANKGVEALSVLVQYLVFNLDAFACPNLKNSQQKTKKQLLEARDHIDEMKSSYQSLEEKLNDREKFFSKREHELQENFNLEILKAQKSLEQLENEKDEAEEKLRQFSIENLEKLKIRDEELESAKDRENDFLKRIQQLTITENELRDKVHSSELEFSEKLQNAMMKERELTEKINCLTKLIDDFKIKTDNEKRELEEKLNLSQDELLIIRNLRNSCTNDSFQNRTLNTSLQDEVESLRCVLELKQSEISELRKTNCELQRTTDDAIATQFKCSALESRVEDLQVQLHAKNEEEKELLQKLKQLQEQNDNIQKKSARLSLHNEELQWRLKQNAERYSMTISELSKSYHESSFSCNRSNDFDPFKSSASVSTLECEDDGNISPPASPIIKGVVEKSDSVSWVLEMDDETPEVLATRMVRRAGSFRSDKCSPSPVPKRQKCQNNTSIQQSASATSILRQHSEPSPLKTTNGRSRSKSVSASKAVETQIKTIPQIVRSMSNNGAVKNLSETAWKHSTQNQMKTSSPNPKKVVSVETIPDDIIIDEDFETAAVAGKSNFFLNDGVVINERETFHRDTAPKFKKSRENRGLITCDTAALTGAELKKHRRPKASAGEIKFSVSGSNSEEEEEDEEQSVNSSSASSTVSTGPSTPSMSSTSTSSSGGGSNQQPMPIESIEDALLRWKEHNNTPMEVSWCEGGPSESCV